MEKESTPTLDYERKGAPTLRPQPPRQQVGVGLLCIASSVLATGGMITNSAPAEAWGGIVFGLSALMLIIDFFRYAP